MSKAIQESEAVNSEIIPYEIPRTDLSVTRDPVAVLEEARRAARALRDVIAQKPDAIIFNGQQYLEFEDWQTVGKFYGVTAKVHSTEFIDYGGVQGFSAKAVVINTHNGMEVSAAESMCLNDEDKWSARTKYEWQYVLKSGGYSSSDPGPDEIVWEPNPAKPGKSRPKKERVRVGEERVPLFQLRSMAQTRACAKALRNVLAWVVVLAGYRPTPAEEMEGGEREPVPPPPAPKVENGGDGHTLNLKPPQPTGDVITEPQSKRFFAIWRSRGWTAENIAQLLSDHGIANDRAIPRRFYDSLCRIVEKQTFDEYQTAKNAQ